MFRQNLISWISVLEYLNTSINHEKNFLGIISYISIFETGYIFKIREKQLLANKHSTCNSQALPCPFTNILQISSLKIKKLNEGKSKFCHETIQKCDLGRPRFKYLHQILFQ